MSILKDILVAKDDLSNEVQWNGRGSVARESSKGVFEFTAGFSSALSLDEVSMIQKTLNRHYTSFVLIMLSIDNITDEANVKDYLGRMHQNMGADVIGLRESFTFDVSNSNINMHRESFNTSTEDTYKYLVDNEMCMSEACVTGFDELEGMNKKKAIRLLEAYRAKGFNIYNNGNSIIVENNSRLEDEPLSESYRNLIFLENADNDLQVFSSKLIPEYNTPQVNYKLAESTAVMQHAKNVIPYKSQFEEKILNEQFVPPKMNIRSSNPIAKQHSRYKDDMMLSEKFNISQQLAGIPQDNDLNGSIDKDYIKNATSIQTKLTDNDVKKANELVPTLVNVKTYFKSKDKKLYPVDYTIGVSVVVSKLNTDELVQSLPHQMKRNKFLVNAIKLTTGEMTFFKDFLFANSRIKEDIKNKFKSNPFIAACLRRKKKHTILKTLNLKQQLVPNATIVISEEERISMNNQFGIDFGNLKTAQSLMNELFLLGFVIVDSATETVKFLFDGKNGWDERSYHDLSKENMNQIKDMKNIVQMMSR